METKKHFYGQINYDALIDAIKTGKISTKIIERKDKTTFRVIDINVWVNDEPKYDNAASISLQLKEEFREEKKPYIGNLKYITSKVQEATTEDFTKDDDLPF